MTVVLVVMHLRVEHHFLAAIIANGKLVRLKLVGALRQHLERLEVVSIAFEVNLLRAGFCLANLSQSQSSVSKMPKNNLFNNIPNTLYHRCHLPLDKS